jgi:hypothetical protein
VMRKVLRSVRPKKGPGHNARPHDCTMFRSTAAMNVSVERKWVGPAAGPGSWAESALGGFGGLGGGAQERAGDFEFGQLDGLFGGRGGGGFGLVGDEHAAGEGGDVTLAGDHGLRGVDLGEGQGGEDGEGEEDEQLFHVVYVVLCLDADKTGKGVSGRSRGG